MYKLRIILLSLIIVFAINAQGVFVEPDIYNGTVLDSMRWQGTTSADILTIRYDSIADEFDIYSPTGTDIDIPGLVVSGYFHLINNDSDDITEGLTNLFFLSSERTKLTGIEALATVDQTASEILTALLTVDGIGSLLDADLLDGTSIADFLLESELSAQETDPVYIADPAFSITSQDLIDIQNLSNINTGDQTASEVEIDEIATATYDDIQDWINNTQSAGKISGGTMSVHWDDITGVTVGGAGSGEFKVADDQTVGYPAGTTINVIESTNNNGNYIVSTGGSSYSAGTTTIPVDEAVATVADGKIRNGRIDIAPGTGFIKTTDSEIGVTKTFDWNASYNLLLTDLETNYIHINYNAGSPIFQATIDRNTIELNREFSFGMVYRNGARTWVHSDGMNLPNYLRNAHERLLAVWGYRRASGGEISEYGTRNIQSTAGVFYRGTDKVITTTQASATDKMTTVYYDGSEWVWTPLETQIDNAQYNDIATGLSALSNNKYGVHWICIDYFGELMVIYGQGNYTLTEAQNATVPSLIPVIADDFGIIASKIIIEKNASSFTEIISAYTECIHSASPATHNELSGLDGGTAGEYYHLTSSEYTSLQSGYQPLESTLTDIADGTIAENLVNTAFPWASNEITEADPIWVSDSTNYLLKTAINTEANLYTLLTDVTQFYEVGDDISADETDPLALKIAGTDNIKDTHIDWGTGANQISAIDILIADAGVIITATEVEGALQENRTAINLNTAKITNATHTGEVTGSGALTIALNAIDGTNIALGSDAQGDIMYYNGTDWVRLGYGNSGYVLHTNGISANPTWDVDDGAGAAGTISKIEESGVQVGGADITLLNFPLGFDITEPIDTEITITFDPSEIAGHDLFSDFVAGEHFLQSAISIPASQISDFDTEVANNSAVTANTAKITTQWTTTGSDIYYNTGLVGIGTDSPDEILTIMIDGVVNSDPAINFYSTIQSGANTTGYNSGKIYSQFDTDIFSGSRLTFANATGVGTYTDVMTLKNGNVGIGTTAPSAKLDIIGNGTDFALEVNNTSTGDGIRINTAATTTNTGLAWYQGSNLVANLYSSSDDAVFGLYNSGVMDIKLNTVGDSWFDGGNVGIGTTSPDYTLDVAGSMGIDNYIYHNGDADTYILYTNDLMQTIIGGVNFIKLIEDDSQDSLVINDSSNDIDVRIESNTDANAFFLQGSSGNIGIGTATPTWILSVHDATTGTGANRIKISHGVALDVVDRTAGIVLGGIEGSDGIKEWIIDAYDDDGWFNSPDFLIYRGDNDSKNDFVIDATGKVGIGTASPETKLHIGGVSASGADGITLSSSATYKHTIETGFHSSTAASNYIRIDMATGSGTQLDNAFTFNAAGDFYAYGNINANNIGMPSFSVSQNDTGQTNIYDQGTSLYNKIRWDKKETGNWNDTDFVLGSGATQSRFTPSVAGLYHFTAVCPLSDDATLDDQMFYAIVLFKNGSKYKEAMIRYSGLFYLQSPTLSAYASANGTTDYFELNVSQWSGQTQKTLNTGDITGALSNYFYWQGVGIP